MTKKEAIMALVEKLAGDDADKIPAGAGASTAAALAFLGECLTVDSGAVKFAIPEEETTEEPIDAGTE